MFRIVSRRSLSSSAHILRSSPPRKTNQFPRGFFSSPSAPKKSTSLNSTRIAILATTVTIGGLTWSISQSPPELCEDPSNRPPRLQHAILKRESGVHEESPMRLRMEALIKEKQREIVDALEKVDGKKFQYDSWVRPNNGGGGTSCVLQGGNVFEKAGVNVSIVYGALPPAAIPKMRAEHKSLGPTTENLSFFAAGLSMVLHPRNPMAPTVHLNYRYFETTKEDGTPNSWWFGGGTDLTPSYLFDEDAIHFHKTLKEACDKHDRQYYPKFKKWCDEYFFVKHRGESRGIGGIFFDDLDDKEPQQLFSFITDCLDSFLPAYIPIIEKRKNLPFTELEKEWQQIRRGRYVEFNLIHDRGTAFGLNTPGSRIESILMSLPLTAQWQYMHKPKPGSKEERTLDVLKTPVEWV